MQKIRVGMLGAGFNRVHARSLAQIPEVEITAVCATTLDSANKFIAQEAGGHAAAYADFQHMLEDASLDVLYVSLPPYAHNGQVEAAARKGIHLFLEKPIAMDSERALSMVNAARESGVFTQVGYHTRFGGAVSELKRLIEDGTAGIPTLFDGRWDCNSPHSLWWRTREKSGGQVFEQLIHTYDAAMHLLGEPMSVSGFMSNMCHKEDPTYTVEDTSVSAIRFRSGALANITGSNCAIPTEWNHTFTVVCSKLTAYFTSPNKAEFVFTDGEKPVRKTIETNTDMYLEENKAFIAAIRGEAPNICTIEEGLGSLRLVEAVVRSAGADGQLVRLG